MRASDRPSTNVDPAAIPLWSALAQLHASITRKGKISALQKLTLHPQICFPGTNFSRQHDLVFQQKEQTCHAGRRQFRLVSFWPEWRRGSTMVFSRRISWNRSQSKRWYCAAVTWCYVTRWELSCRVCKPTVNDMPAPLYGWLTITWGKYACPVKARVFGLLRRYQYR